MLPNGALIHIPGSRTFHKRYRQLVTDYHFYWFKRTNKPILVKLYREFRDTVPSKICSSGWNFNKSSFADGIFSRISQKNTTCRFLHFLVFHSWTFCQNWGRLSKWGPITFFLQIMNTLLRSRMNYAMSKSFLHDISSIVAENVLKMGPP